MNVDTQYTVESYYVPLETIFVAREHMAGGYLVDYGSGIKGQHLPVFRCAIQKEEARITRRMANPAVTQSKCQEKKIR